MDSVCYTASSSFGKVLSSRELSVASALFIQSMDCIALISADPEGH